MRLDLDRVPIGTGPTPVRRLTAASRRGPADVWLKDDALYGPHSGNKARKLEWLLGAARRRGAQTVITSGAIGTNHGLATALYARELGMRTVLVLVPQPESAQARAQLARIRRSGAEVHPVAGRAGAVALTAWLLVARAGPGLHLPALILPGGSTPLGCVGYVEAGLELGRQVAAGEVPEPSHVVVALGSGGTAAGLLLGLRLAGLRSRLVAVSVNDLTPLGPRALSRLASRTQRLLQRHNSGPLPRVALGPGDLDVATGWLGEGYGHETAAGAAAIEALGPDRVSLEPVYTAKAAAALLEINSAGGFGAGPVLFWQTHRPPKPPNVPE
ncbi:MAG: pyridoxal-phosphate dependent enzyme [Solirubrobacterales bacterium]